MDGPVYKQENELGVIAWRHCLYKFTPGNCVTLQQLGDSIHPNQQGQNVYKVQNNPMEKPNILWISFFLNTKEGNAY